MKKSFTKASVYCSLLLSLAGAAKAQDTTTTTEFKPHGNLWGYTFGDFDYKGNADNLNRGGSNQYTGMPMNANTFQFRRVYLGYNFDITQKFSTEFLLAAEDDFNTGSITEGTAGTSVGDVTAGGKFTPYLKLANLRWKNIFKNSDLVIGQQSTPGFAKTGRNDQTAEEVWGYRCVERTVSDIRRTPSFDMGASLQGWFDKKGNYGYMAMVGNGTGGAKPETNTFKSLYGDVYAKFFDKKLIIDLYADYTKLAWGVWDASTTKVGTESLNGPQYGSREMTKLFLAYNTNKLTIGFEGFMNTFLGGLKVTETDKNIYYRTFSATDLSFYVRGRIISAPNGDPRLNYFVRYDNYNPSNGLSTVASNATTTAITTATGVSNYDPFTKESFFTAGIDYMPAKNVHLIPNIWLNTYASSLSYTGSNDAVTPIPYTKYSSEVNNVKGTDAVWRLTFYYIFNAKAGTTKY
jgi:hypothetical protein